MWAYALSPDADQWAVLQAVNPMRYINNKCKLEAGHEFVNCSLIEQQTQKEYLCSKSTKRSQ